MILFFRSIGIQGIHIFWLLEVEAAIAPSRYAASFYSSLLPLLSLSFFYHPEPYQTHLGVGSFDVFFQTDAHYSNNVCCGKDPMEAKASIAYLLSRKCWRLLPLH